MSDDRFTTPEDAEAAFYDAFQRLDLEAMMRVWADEETIVCVHPMGPRLGGRAAVAQSWREIFAGGSPMRFELTA
ncbi:MAG: nuclear transport factor 2 family protein, partial [Gammaproteobacteria bacterium]|nr:nuclear transport factor 2 family protein [Gammaproteobacteria bacterium]